MICYLLIRLTRVLKNPCCRNIFLENFVKNVFFSSVIIRPGEIYEGPLLQKPPLKYLNKYSLLLREKSAKEKIQKNKKLKLNVTPFLRNSFKFSSFICFYI